MMAVVVTRAALHTLGDIALIPLTRGEVAIVDATDAVEILRHRWYCKESVDGRKYAMRTIGLRGMQRTIRMHREVLGLNNSEWHVDHRNGNGLDNRRVNLRLTDPGANNGNAQKRSGMTSTYKGVSWYKRSQKWRASIKGNYRMRHLGYYDTQEDAAYAYDRAARQIFGEFAALNFPSHGERSALTGEIVSRESRS